MASFRTNGIATTTRDHTPASLPVPPAITPRVQTRGLVLNIPSLLGGGRGEGDKHILLQAHPAPRVAWRGAPNRERFTWGEPVTRTVCRRLAGPPVTRLRSHRGHPSAAVQVPHPRAWPRCAANVCLCCAPAALHRTCEGGWEWWRTADPQWPWAGHTPGMHNTSTKWRTRRGQ